MERAKRLELRAEKSETPERIVVMKSANSADTQLSTHAGNDLAEIVSAWPALSPEVRAAVLSASCAPRMASLASSMQEV